MENYRNKQNTTSEIDLIDIIKVMLERRKFIICFTIIISIIAGIISKFVLTPVYDTRINIVANIASKYDTRYGEYVLPIATNYQLIELILSNEVLLKTIEDMNYNTAKISVEGLRRRINIVKHSSSDTQNNFEVIVSADDPKESLVLAENLYNNYFEFMNVMIKKMAIKYYTNVFSVNSKSLEYSLKSIKETLLKNQELLNDTPRLIDDAEVSLELQTQLTEDSNYIIPTKSINPSYLKIENDIINNKQDIIRIENSINMYNQYLSELEHEMKIVAKYEQEGMYDKLDGSAFTGIVESSIYLPSKLVAPMYKTSPSNMLNVLIGAVIGCITGVIIVLFKEYILIKDINNKRSA